MGKSRLAGALLVVALATNCGGKGSGEKIVPLGSDTTAAGGTATTGGPATTVPNDRAVAERFAQLLDQNSGARDRVTTLVQGVSSCQLNPRQSHDDLGPVIITRKARVDEVNQLDVRSLPEGPNLQSNLIQAWQASIAADVQFQGWMLRVASSGCTPNGVNSGPEWDAASASSAQATAFKQNFSTVWAGVAARFGLRPWAEGEL